MIFNVLIVGAGNIASGYDEISSDMFLTHAHAFKIHEGFNLVGFVDNNKEKANSAAKKWKTRAFYTLESAFEFNSRIDVYCIAVPDNLHYDFLKRVYDLNPKLVFSEKPLTQTLSESLEIKDLYEKKQIPLMVNFKRSFIPEFIQLGNEIKEGKFGVFWDCFGYYNRGFRHNGSHLLDLFVRMTGINDLTLTHLIDQICDYSTSDPSYSFVAKSMNGSNFVLKSYDGELYPIFEMDLHFSEGRVRIIDAGEMIEIYRNKPSSFKGLAAIKRDLSISTSLNQSLLFSAQNIFNHLAFGEEIISSVDEVIQTMRILEKIKVSIKKNYE